MLRGLALAFLVAGPAAAQDVGPLLAQTLGADAIQYVWLPDSTDPTRMKEAVGVAYIEIPGAAGNTDIAVGYYRMGAQDIVFVGKVGELYGQDPRDPRFLADRIEITTTMPGPDDPRCCPTATARWSIDRGTLIAKRTQ